MSIGLSVSPGDGSDPQILLQNCGVAMSRAKGIGRNSYHFFTPGMNQQAAERLDIETQLRRALERSEFSLVFQPVLDLASDLMTGCEALLRWDSPILGQITPDRFIPLAEDTGLIVPIGAWVLKQACLEAKQWLDQGWNLSIAVNLSPRQLRHPGLIDDVTLALKESGLPAERLELEVTESVLIDDPIRAAAVLKELNDLRIRLSIDDFGTGYSSLSYLKRFPFQSLKIDRSFIRDPLSDPNDRALIKAIIALAKSLNLRVVAEGVETYAQLDFLRDQGCDVAQGFHFCRPLPALQTDDFARPVRRPPGSAVARLAARRKSSAGPAPPERSAHQADHGHFRGCVLRLLFQFGNQCADVIDGEKRPRRGDFNDDGTRRQQGKAFHIAVAVGGGDAAGGPGLDVVETFGIEAKGVEEAFRHIDRPLRRRTGKADEKIVAADMAEKAFRRQMLAHQFAKQQNRAVALAEAVFVVERLEIVEIHIGVGIGAAHIAEAVADELIDQGIAGQFGQRVLVTGLGKAFFIDDTDDRARRKKADITHLIDQDDAFGLLVSRIDRHDALDRHLHIGNRATDDEILEFSP